MDHRDLLIKYIRYVLESEGTNFIDDFQRDTDQVFTAEEWEELEALAAETRKE